MTEKANNEYLALLFQKVREGRKYIKHRYRQERPDVSVSSAGSLSNPCNKDMAHRRAVRKRDTISWPQSYDPGHSSKGKRPRHMTGVNIN